jgi:hypothetical protein
MAIPPLPQMITAIGGLGTAAFGLVDATKAIGGGVNHIGFAGIRNTVTALTPEAGGTGPMNGLSREKILATLQANWFNGVDLGSQKAIAKSLIKLHLSSTNAADLATATAIDGPTLTAIATSMATGTPLTAAQSDVFGRFDLIVTAMLDEAYQRSEQQYKNGTRAWAMVIAVILAIVGGQIAGIDTATSILIGLVATPLAPIAKDLSSALASAVSAAQSVKK